MITNIKIARRDDEALTVRAFVADGLAIHRDLEDSRRFMVSHIASGLAIQPSWPKAIEARRYMKALLPLTNWNDVPGRAIGRKERKEKLDLYRQILAVQEQFGVSF